MSITSARYITLGEYMKGARAPEGQALYIWTEVGDGKLYPVAYVTPDYWVNTGKWSGSFCCHGGTRLIQCTLAEAPEIERALSDVLKARRDHFNNFNRASSVQGDAFAMLRTAPEYPYILHA